MEKVFSNCKNPLEKEVYSRVKTLLLKAKTQGFIIPSDRDISLTLKFNIRSPRFAGQAKFNPLQRVMELRFHPGALQNYTEDYLNQTVPHEVAHLIQFINAPRDLPHGNYFKKIMALFGAIGKRCCNYNLAAISTSRRVAKRVTYVCGCSEHKVTQLIHKRMAAGQRRRCCGCKGLLTKK